MKNEQLSLDIIFSKHGNNFDFLRFIAATIVMFSHSYPLSSGLPDPKVPFLANTFGGLGVYIFFIISGFLVTSSFMRNPYIIPFMMGRILRILPGLGVVLLLSAFVLGPLVTQLSIKEYFSNYQTYSYLKTFFLYPVQYALPGVFANNPYPKTVNGSLWTLSYEFTCYLIVLILGSLGLLHLKIFSLSLLSLMIALFSFNLAPNIVIFNIIVGQFIGFFSYFAMGIFLYTYREIIPLNKNFAACCILILIISSFFGGLSNYLFVIFGGYLILFIAASPDINFRMFGKYGDFSYGIYIYAFPVQQTVSHFLGPIKPMLHFAISFPITLLCSILSWHLIEKHCLKFKKYFRLQESRNN